MEEFVNGELVILHNPTYFNRWSGALGVVVGLRQQRSALDMHTGETNMLDAYRVRVLEEDGLTVICERHQLKKLPMPGRQLGQDKRIEQKQPAPEFVE